MTPYQLFREAPVRIRTGSWPTLWKVLVCSALSTTLAVVLMAWQASRFCSERHHHAQPELTSQPAWPSTAEIRNRMEVGCTALARMRADHSGLYAGER